MSHLSSSDEKYNSYNNSQKLRFLDIIKKYNKKNIIFSLSNSNGAILNNSYLFHMVRPGIGLYGGHDKLNLKKYIKPVVNFKGKIIQIKKIYKNEYIGYNQTLKTKKTILAAIIGIGYADGIPRSLSNKGVVYFKNNKFKIIGRISMDSFTIDITKSRNNLKVGMYIDIINDKHTVELFAKQCDTISYEVLTSIGSRINRIYD